MQSVDRVATGARSRTQYELPNPVDSGVETGDLAVQGLLLSGALQHMFAWQVLPAL